MKYRPEIDGLRAIAVIPVVLFHAEFSIFSGGFVGVDIFFVISGYLITTIILTEMEQGRFSLVNFYEKRARRILPALFLVMFISLFFAWFVLLPNDMREFSQSLIATSLFSSNILFWHESGYWAAASELKPLLHTWSLAVEEQYYVLFPLFLMLMWKYRKRWIFGALILIAAISLAVAHWGSYHKPVATFYLLPTRSWELAIGAGIAFHMFYRKKSLLSNKKIQESLGLLGLAMICFAILLYDNTTPFPSLYALLPTIGAGLVILFASSQTISGRLLKMKLLVAVGLISYSVYLWHQPLLAFTKYSIISNPSDTTYVVLAFLPFPLAYLSWKFIEKPFRLKRKGEGKKFIFIFSLIGSTVFIVAGIAGHFSNGFESAWLSRQSQTDKPTYHYIVYRDSIIDNYGANKDGAQDNGDCRFNMPNLDAKIKQRIKDCYKKYDKGYVILGDSHAIDLFGVATSSNTHPFIIGLTQAGCRPHTTASVQRICQYNNFLKFVKKNKSIFYGVLYEQAGFYLLRNDKIKGHRSIISGTPYGEKLEGVYLEQENISKVFHYLESLSKYTNVIWFGSRIEPHIPKSMVLKMSCDSHFMLRPNQKEVFEHLDTYLSNITTGKNNFHFASQNKLFRYSFPADFMDCNGVYWTDGDHLNAQGEERFGKRFNVTNLFHHDFN